MITESISVDALSPKASNIKRIADALKAGAIVAVPTETVYGLAVDAGNKKALDRLYSIKNRPCGKPFALQIADLSELDRYIDEPSPGLIAMLKKFWPGPLTVILNGRDGKVGLRIPGNKTTLAIIREVASPLAVTSANISGEPAAFSAEEVMRILEGKIEMVVDDGTRCGGIESTVLDCTVSPFKIVRPGAILEQLKSFL